MKSRPFAQVDVFTTHPYRGNPLAVVLDGTGLSDEDMQRFARWTNLSETTFVLPPMQTGADYRVRIFTPGGELAFAGHPTLGTCHAWLQAHPDAAGCAALVQECGVGLVTIRRQGTELAFAAPALQRGAVDDATLAALAVALGLAPSAIVAAQMLNNGTPWLGLLLRSPQTVLQLNPDHAALKNLGHKVGVVGIAPTADSAASHVEVRAFAACIGVPEDPVTGSLNASLAQWLIAERHLPTHYTATQGTRLQRHGQVQVTQDDDGQVWIGGEVVTCVQGQVHL